MTRSAFICLAVSLITEIAAPDALAYIAQNLQALRGVAIKEPSGNCTPIMPRPGRMT